MNRTVRFTFTMILVVMLTACAAPAQILATSTIIPPTPTVYHPPHTQLATDKLRKTYFPVQFTLPGMDQVTVANVPYKEGLTMDVYYPPDFDFSSPAPAVVFVNVFGAFGNTRLKDWGPYVSWGQLAAASGLIGINYDHNEFTNDPRTDLRDLIAFIETNAPMLGVEKDHLCLWSASSNTPYALEVLLDKEGEYQQVLSCAVIYYGDAIETDYFPTGLSLFIVNVREDSNNFLDKFANKAKEAGLTVELIMYEGGKHGFDYKQDTEETRDIVSRTLEFMKENLSAP